MEKQPKTCGFGKQCKPTNRKLYKKLKINAIRSSAKWPSRYASYELVSKYKKAGGKYHCFGNACCEKCKKSSFGSCGCANKQRQPAFGASFESFYKPGAPKNTFLTPQIKQCLNVIYGPRDSGYTGTPYKPDIQRSLGFGKRNSDILYLKNILLR